MELTAIAVLAGGFLLFSLISGRLEGTVLTAPLMFVVFGFIVGDGTLGLVSMDTNHETIHIIAELTLILVLTADAARLDLRRLKADHNVPVRMLLLGLPGAMALGTLLAVWLFPAMSLYV